VPDFDFGALQVVERSRLMTRLVAPRPIAFVSTLSAAGDGNLAPFSYFTGGGSNPSSVVFCCVNDRHGAPKHTLRNIVERGEYVISVVSHAMAERMNVTSFDYPYGVDEFEKSGFTRRASVRVAPPGVAEAPARLECRLFQVVPHGTGPSAGSYVIGEVVYATVDDDACTGGLPDNAKLDQLARLGGDYYTHVPGDALFEMKRPTTP
jgi:flavin reductase (DIM6/NTAB) family NADH-FMN oxidoreductase RutF